MQDLRDHYTPCSIVLLYLSALSSAQSQSSMLERNPKEYYALIDSTYPSKVMATLNELLFSEH